MFNFDWSLYILVYGRMVENVLNVSIFPNGEVTSFFFLQKI